MWPAGSWSWTAARASRGRATTRPGWSRRVSVWRRKRNRSPRGGIVGVIGPNGAGKTTLFRMIVGQENPDAGSLRVGETVMPAYVDQNRDALDGSKTVFEEITGGTDFLMLGRQRVASRGYVA